MLVNRLTPIETAFIPHKDRFDGRPAALLQPPLGLLAQRVDV